MIHYLYFIIKKQTKEIMYTDNKLISEVEKNQKLVMVNDVLLYIDESNCQKWTVTELFEGGFEAKDSEGNEDFFFFNQLQLGWYFTETTKEQNFLNHRFRYAA